MVRWEVLGKRPVASQLNEFVITMVRPRSRSCGQWTCAGSQVLQAVQVYRQNVQHLLSLTWLQHSLRSGDSIGVCSDYYFECGAHSQAGLLTHGTPCYAALHTPSGQSG